jgi:predicted metal-dependent HD superfamily phosphohydrolase
MLVSSNRYQHDLGKSSEMPMNTPSSAYWLTWLPPLLRAADHAALWPQLQSAYATPPRAYHSWQHVEACLEAAQSYVFDEPVSVYLALLFHDAIYIAGRKDNEALSARLMQDCLAPHPALHFADPAATRMILATANHAALPPDAPRDDQLMVDIDLGILATAPHIYTRYAAQVRQEWVPAVVSEAQFNVGRTQFLCATLQAPRVFHSAEFAHHEAAARRNMEAELAQLCASPAY